MLHIIPTNATNAMNPDSTTIYMTYHSIPPESVIRSWLALNPRANIDFSLDADCIAFLAKEFNPNIAELFKYIPRGMYKADLWRLCKLYIHGGVYADIDLVPFRSLAQITGSVAPSLHTHTPTFYSCLSMCDSNIFQAFMKHTRERSPLILGFLISFLLNKPYTMIDNGPTIDMYNFILYNVRAQAVRDGANPAQVPTSVNAYTHYPLRQIRIPIRVDTLAEDIVHLHYFPVDITYTYTLSVSPSTKNKWVLANEDKLKMKIENHCLLIETTDTVDAMDASKNPYINDTYIVDICIDLPENEPEVIYLFEEKIRNPPNISTCYVSDCNGMNIMDCRAPNYFRDRGWFR